MRFFTNKQGEKVTVSEEHLRKAVAIKKQLQNASPSRRCNWSLLIELMAKEGFPEAENSENYRCLVKAYQKEIGELPEVAKYADMVADSKLESIKELVGEIAYEKRENQHVLRELNKVKREVIDFTLTAELIGKAFKEYDFTSFKFDSKPIESVSGKKMVVCLSDLHIGAVVDNEFNTYNYGVAKNRLQQYLHKVINECKIHNITDVFVMNLGDVLEHSTMRYSQAYNVEFPFSEQIVKASDIIIKFLVGLAEHVNVEYAGIAGNHDRITDKDKNIDGDHAVKAINYAIKTFIENSKIKRITYEQANDYSYSKQINGRNFKFVHGDLDSMKDENLIAKHSAIDGVSYDVVCMGHFHHFRDIEVGLDKRIVAFGTLKGADDYAVKIRKLSTPSQGIIIVDENGEIDVKRIALV